MATMHAQPVLGAAVQPGRAPARGTARRGRPRGRPDRRGRLAAPARARHPRRPAAAAGPAADGPRPGRQAAGPGPAAGEGDDRRGDAPGPRHRGRAAVAVARDRAAAARRPRPGRGARRADRAQRRSRSSATIDVPGPLPPARRDRRLLRGRRGADQRRQAQRRRPRPRSAWSEGDRRRSRCGSRTTESAARIPARAAAWPGSQQRVRPPTARLEMHLAGAADPTGACTACHARLARRHEDRRRGRLAAPAGGAPAAARRGRPRGRRPVGDGPSFVAAALEHRPDVGLVDVRMPPSHTDEGLRAAVEVRRDVAGGTDAWCSRSTSRCPTPTTCSPSGDGGVGYLLKDRVSDLDDFLAALATVADGRHRRSTRRSSPS